MEPVYMMKKRKTCWQWAKRKKTRKEKLGKYRRIGAFSTISSEVAQFASIYTSLHDCKKPDAGEILIDGQCPVESKPKINVCNVATDNNNQGFSTLNQSKLYNCFVHS